MTQPKIDHFEAVRGPPNAPGTGPDDSIKAATVDGVSCYAFTLRDGDVQAWDVGNIGPSGKANQRAEISFAPAPGPLKITSQYNVTEKAGKQTYDIRYRFKGGWPQNQRWAMISQFHIADDFPPGLPTGFPGISVHGNSIDALTPFDPAGGTFYRETIKTDVWLDRRLVVNWSSTADGYVKIVDRTTGALLGRYNGPTIPGGTFKYLKQGLYRDGGITAEGTIYETLIDISPGDLTETAPTKKKNSAPLDPTKPSVQPNDGAQALISVRDQLVALKDSRLQPQIDAVNKLLDNGAWTP